MKAKSHARHMLLTALIETLAAIGYCLGLVVSFLMRCIAAAAGANGQLVVCAIWLVVVAILFAFAITTGASQ